MTSAEGPTGAPAKPGGVTPPVAADAAASLDAAAAARSAGHLIEQHGIDIIPPEDRARNAPRPSPCLIWNLGGERRTMALQSVRQRPVHRWYSPGPRQQESGEYEWIPRSRSSSGQRPPPCW